MSTGVVTLVELNTQQIKVLIDTLKSADSLVSKNISLRHKVDVKQLETHLQVTLETALAEL